jgi:hypothetical protein
MLLFGLPGVTHQQFGGFRLMPQAIAWCHVGVSLLLVLLKSCIDFLISRVFHLFSAALLKFCMCAVCFYFLLAFDIMSFLGCSDDLTLMVWDTSADCVSTSADGVAPWFDLSLLA